MEIKAKGQTGGLGGNFLLKSEKLLSTKKLHLETEMPGGDAKTGSSNSTKLNISQEKTKDYRASTLACSLLLTKSDD